MKNKLVALIITIGFIMICTGCANVEQIPEPAQTSMFVKVEDSGTFSIVYHRKTKVMYAVSTGGYNSGNFTLLVNADGSPMIYEEE